jgi:hypothetical protein
VLVSVRSTLAAGVAAVTVGAIVTAPSVGPVAAPVSAQPVALTAAQTPTPQFAAIVEAARQQVLAIAAPPAPPAPPTTPAPQNAASDFIVNAWDAAVPWIDYGVDLATYVLQFVPFGYLVGDQINIFYNSLFPIADSFVLDLVAPVVDDPLNLNVWANGIGDVARTSVTSFVNLGINEFNYFFGWLIPPIPPIGPLATATLASSTDYAGALRASLADAGARLTAAVEHLTGVDLTAPRTPDKPAETPDKPVETTDEQKGAPTADDDAAVTGAAEDKTPEVTAPDTVTDPQTDDAAAAPPATRVRHSIGTQVRDSVRKATEDTRKTLDGLRKAFTAHQPIKKHAATKDGSGSDATQGADAPKSPDKTDKTPKADKKDSAA